MSSKGGRFGKYGEHKKNEKLRKAKTPGPERRRYTVKQDERRKIEPRPKKRVKR